jgi:hypothetical protein
VGGSFRLIAAHPATKTARNPQGCAPLHSYSSITTTAKSWKLFYSVHRRMISVALIPPNPNEFESATSKLCATALFGT